MNLASASYNERSWAIDLIGHIKQIANNNNRSVKDAGGEQTIQTDGGVLFPDVLLFGDQASAKFLQGWELKMPDTSIDDIEFRDNAERKALALGLDSFLLWNVSVARLYAKNPNADEFIVTKEWRELIDIQTRQAVVSNRNRWKELCEVILTYLNDLFDNGSLEGRQFIEAYRTGGLTSLIMQNSSLVATALDAAATRDSTLRFEMELWWDKYKAEYGGTDRTPVLARAVISNWIGKILFAHILREQDQRAVIVDRLAETANPREALAIFQRLSNECNFWTIFSDSIGLQYVPEQTWSHLKQFSSLLTDLRIGTIDQFQLSGVLEATVEVAVRKLRGQYPTPLGLARLLVQLCMRNTEADRIFDPCCGSGTIARAALEQKLEIGMSPEDATRGVFASDQDPQAIQIATFALAKPILMHTTLRVFQRDAFTLSTDTEIDFRNPSNGAQFSEILGEFDAIISNLPFVAQAGRSQYVNALTRINSELNRVGFSLSGRADVAAYLPFALHPLLARSGRLGVIITNAWLGTEWGDEFYRSLNHYYKLISVVTSGAGRWFQNSNVVTNLLILEKSNDAASDGVVSEDHEVKFIVLNRPIEELTDIESLHITAAQIELGRTHNDTMSIRAVSHCRIEQFRKYGLGGNAQFVNCNWVLDLPIVPLRSLFDIRRGERTGMNRLFYPQGNHGIEDEYLRPLAKSPSAFKRLLGTADGQAFCCSRTESDLQDMGHTGALNWISRFRTPDNISRLGRGNALWYELTADTLADLVMPIAFGDRLFVPRVDPAAIADQRFITLHPKDGVNVRISQALLNSAIGLFMLEGLGFGRGQGALDLNKDRIEHYLHVLDITTLRDTDAARINDAFTPLLNRDVMDVADELEQEDRRNFDDTILDVFRITTPREHIYNNLRSLVGIRQTANG